MAYLISFILLSIIFIAMHYFTELTKTHKISITAILFIIIFFAVSYNTYNKDQSEKLLETVKKFNQNKTIKCDNTEVNQSNYTLSIGTFTFIGKENTPYYQDMIPASSCEK